MSDFTYTEYHNGDWGVIIDECALSYNCKTEAQAIEAALEHCGSVIEELRVKYRELTGESYD